MTQYNITDDSGFLAIANPDTYNAFVDPDWEFEDLKQRFTAEMTNNHLIIWNTGAEEKWNIHILTSPSGQAAFREFEKTIEVTNNRLLLTNYENLTMAAQFTDITLTTEAKNDEFITISNGLYKTLVRQMSDPEKTTSTLPHFEIVFTPLTTAATEQIDNIFWKDPE